MKSANLIKVGAFFLMLLLSSFSALRAQNEKPFDIPTPNATDLGSYGNIPISYYTGQPEVCIPLYSFTIKGVSLPINLVYNASGVLINKLPGWLGDNWSLSAGGAITRIIQGYCDEYAYPVSVLDPHLEKNYFHSYSILRNFMNGTNPDYQALKDSIKENKFDLAADIFYFNFMGKSGRFFLGNDGEWRVYSDENLDIIFDINDESNYIAPFITDYPYNASNRPQPKTIKGFIIRDESGIEYHFGGSQNSIEYSTPFLRQSDREESQPWNANSWYLTKIADRNGNVLFTFNYERGKFLAQLYNAAVYRTFKLHIVQNGHTNIFNNPSSNNYDFPFDGVLNAPVYLSSITAQDGRVLKFQSSNLSSPPTLIYKSMYDYFSSITDWYNTLCNPKVCPYRNQLPCYYLQTNNAAITQYQNNANSSGRSINPLIATCLRKLDTIELYGNSSNNCLGKFIFSYNASSRIYLLSVRQWDSTNGNVGQYSFAYNNYQDLPGEYISNAEDHWGYYNGNTITSYPNSDSGFLSFYSQKEPNATKTLYGMLSSITYPTGGKTCFEFEAHDYSSYMKDGMAGMNSVNPNKIAGGARIYRITEYANSTDSQPSTTRTFTYKQPNSTLSSGQLYAQGKYYWPSWKADSWFNNADIVTSLFKYTSTLPLSTSTGPHIGYSYVRETFGDGTSNVYHYTNLSDYPDSRFILDFNNSTLSPYDRYTEREYKRGKLLSVEAFDASNHLKQSTTYNYRVDDVEADYVVTSSITTEDYTKYLELYNPDGAYIHYLGGVYKLFCPKYDVIQELTTTYNSNGNLLERKEYNRFDYRLSVSYGNYAHYVRIRKMLSEKVYWQTESVEHYYQYPFSLSSNEVTSELFYKQFYIPIVSVEQKNNESTIQKDQTTYARFNGLIMPRYKIRYTGSESQTLISYNSYTNKGALTQYQEIGKPITTLTWLNNDCYLESKREGGLLYTSYSYDQLGNLHSITNPNGNSFTYTYDTWGRLKKIEDNDGNTVKNITYNYQNK